MNHALLNGPKKMKKKLKKIFCLSLICTSVKFFPTNQLNIIVIGEINSSQQTNENKLTQRPWKSVAEQLKKKEYTIDTPPIKKNQLKNIKYIVDTTENSSFNINTIDQLPSEKLILFLWEPPVVCPHLYNPSLHKKIAKVFTWNDNLVDNKKYFKAYYPVYDKQHNQPIVDFKQKKFCTLINNNKHSPHPQELYSERREILNFFEQLNSDDFEFYGHWWNPREYKNYRGSIPYKQTYLSHYKFCIAYENMKNTQGYVTEKMINSLQVGCVPVYWGANNIEQYVPVNCFIDRRRFKNNMELYQFMKNMPEHVYNHYIENIKTYLESDQIQRFTFEYFVQTVVKELLK